MDPLENFIVQDANDVENKNNIKLLRKFAYCTKLLFNLCSQGQRPHITNNLLTFEVLDNDELYCLVQPTRNKRDKSLNDVTLIQRRVDITRTCKISLQVWKHFVSLTDRFKYKNQEHLLFSIPRADNGVCMKNHDIKWKFFHNTINDHLQRNLNLKFDIPSLPSFQTMRRLFFTHGLAAHHLRKKEEEFMLNYKIFINDEWVDRRTRLIHMNDYQSLHDDILFVNDANINQTSAEREKYLYTKLNTSDQQKVNYILYPPAVADQYNSDSDEEHPHDIAL